MLAIANRYFERRSRPVVSCISGSGIRDQLAVLEIPIGAGFFVAPQPPANPNHQAVLRPIREGVVGRVKAAEPATVLHPLLEPCPDLGRPFVASWKFVVV